MTLAGKIATNYREGSRWLRAYNGTNVDIAPFAPCYIYPSEMVDFRTGQKNTQENAYAVSPFIKSDGVVPSVDITGGGLDNNYVYGRAMLCVNGPSVIRGKASSSNKGDRYGSVTADFPALARVGSDTLQMSAMVGSNMYPDVASVEAGEAAVRFGPVPLIGPHYYYNFPGSLYAYGAIFGDNWDLNEAVNILQFDDPGSLDGLCWIAPANSQDNTRRERTFYGSDIALDQDGDYIDFEGTSPVGDLLNSRRKFFPISIYDNTVEFYRPGIYEITVQVIFEGEEVEDSKTIPSSNVTIRGELENVLGNSTLTNATGMSASLIAETISPAITGLTNDPDAGYGDCACLLTASPCYRTSSATFLVSIVPTSEWVIPTLDEPDVDPISTIKLRYIKSGDYDCQIDTIYGIVTPTYLGTVNPVNPSDDDD